MEQNIPDALKQLPYNWELNPEYNNPHLGAYVYVRDNGHIAMPLMGPGYYMESKEHND
jgi:hypothetical protein